MKEVARALVAVTTAFPDVVVIFPVHPNPLVRDVISAEVSGNPRIHLIEALSYADFTHLMSECDLILTDSGGVQEEAPALGKPVLVLRETTERSEAVDAGTVRLVGTGSEKIVEACSQLLRDPERYAEMARAVNPYGDGRAASRCVAAIAHYLRGEPRPVDFAVSSRRVQYPLNGCAFSATYGG
jgi:UDP-N-acetylglucosamine 2-epimerase (non-hydrolysing)